MKLLIQAARLLWKMLKLMLSGLNNIQIRGAHDLLYTNLQSSLPAMSLAKRIRSSD